MPEPKAAKQIERQRSRSPPQQRFSARSLPEVNTWVQVCLDSLKSGKSRRWAKATPALVSKVTVTTANEEGAKGEVLINVLSPNLLALQCNFKASAAYKEMKDLKLADVRPYRGNDQQRLKKALLDAVREKARQRATAHVVPFTVEDSEAATKQEQEELKLEEGSNAMRQWDRNAAAMRRVPTEEVVATPPLNATERSDSTQAEAPIQIEEFDARDSAAHLDAVDITPRVKRLAPCDLTPSPPRNETPFGDMVTTRQNIAKFFEASKVEKDDTQAPFEIEDSVPAVSWESLMAAPHASHVQDPAPSLIDSAAPLIVVQSSIKVVESKAVKDAGLLTRQRLLEITKLVVRAFAGEGTQRDSLSVQEIADVAAQKGLQLHEGELQKALQRLDADNKILLSDDLVFSVC